MMSVITACFANVNMPTMLDKILIKKNIFVMEQNYPNSLTIN